MDQKRTQEPQPADRASSEESWREVGRQFEALGESISRALRAAWESEETQAHVQSMREGLEKMVGKVDHAVGEIGKSDRARRVQAEAERTAESLRDAGEKTWEDVRPQVISGLRKVNSELQQLIESLDRGRGDVPASPIEGQTQEAGVASGPHSEG